MSLERICCIIRSLPIPPTCWPLPIGWTLSAYDLNDSSVTTGLSVEEDGSVSVRLSNLIGNDARICQDVEVSADTVYRLRAYVKTESVSGGQGATLSIDNYSIDGCFCYSQPLTGNDRLDRNSACTWLTGRAADDDARGTAPGRLWHGEQRHRPGFPAFLSMRATTLPPAR